MTASRGSRSNSARATVRPPIPESNTPSGALFMNGKRDADTAGECADLQIGREIAQVRRDVGFRAREEMVEDPQDGPVLHFLLFQLDVRRVNRLEIVDFLLRLEGHHRGHAFPRHERRAGGGATRDGLAPARNKEGAPEGSHRSDALADGVCGKAVAHGRRILSRQRRGAEKQYSQCEPHRATSTFSLPRSNSTVHSFVPGSRSSPSTWTTSGCSGARTTSFAVLTIATSRIEVCVPRSTRGIAMRNRGNDTRRITHTSIFPSVGSASGANR